MPKGQKSLTIDEQLLILGVKNSGKAIWDKESEGYSNKTDLQKAWERVLEFLGIDPKDKAARKYKKKFTICFYSLSD